MHLNHHYPSHLIINHLIIITSSSNRRHNSNRIISSNRSIQVHPKDTSVVYAISLDIGYNNVLRRMIKIIIIINIINNKNSSNGTTTLTVMIISRIIQGWVGLMKMVGGCNIAILIITWRVHHSSISHHVNIMMNIVMNILYHHLHNTIMMNVHHLLIVHRRVVANIMNVNITNNIISVMNLLIMSNVSTTNNIISVMNLIITNNINVMNNVSIPTNASSTIMNVNNNNTNSSSSNHLKDMFVVFVIFLDIGLNFVLRVVVVTMEVD